MTHNQRLTIINITNRLEAVHNTLYKYEQAYKSPTLRNIIDEIGLIQAIIKNLLKGRR